MAEPILIIKHGALGDLILSTGPMKSIRNHHPDAEITLLTTKPYRALMGDCPFIDHIFTDPKPKLWQFAKLFDLRRLLRTQHWSWVYDLQTSRRSTAYFPLLHTDHYSGLHPKGSHPHDTAERTHLHTIERQRQQLELAGVANLFMPDVSWLEDDSLVDHITTRSSISPQNPSSTPQIALLVPGGAPHRPEKRWPAEHYRSLAQQLIERNYTPVLIGTKAEAEIINTIASSDDRIINLMEQTSFAQLASLARKAAYAVGNDTGPMHLIAAVACPCTVIFNITASNPARSAPRSNRVNIIQSDDPASIRVEEVIAQITTNLAE